MSENSFRFRQFTVHQDKCAMKVGTDSVLFGSWVQPNYAKRILDIGTGTGILALMMAQKSEADIDAVDIDENAYLQSVENFKLSPWFQRLHSYHSSFQEFADRTDSQQYDLIIANPPYFHHASKPFGESRINARHNDALSFDELVAGVKKMLHPRGRLCVILPCKEGMEFMDKAQREGLFCHELVRIKTKADKVEKRLIIKFGFALGITSESEIIIQEEDGSFTNEYIELTRDFYFQLKPVQSSFH